MKDIFESHALSLSAPATNAAAITPDDAAAGFDQVTRAIYVGIGGNVRAEMASGEAVTFAAMAGGMIYPVRIRKVFASGTTASGLISLW